MKRRSFLWAGLGAIGLGITVWKLKIGLAPGGLSRAERRILDAYLDRLIPADETPGAVALGIGQRLIDRAAEQPGLRRLIAEGCLWLEGEAGGFGDLEPSQQDRLIARAEAAAPGTLQRRFFSATRHLAMAEYYADPRSWEGLPYAGPPQPLGFADYQRPPRPA